MKDQLKRILRLVRKTGDTMIVTDSDGNDAYVVMDLDQYERLLDAKSDGLNGFDEPTAEEVWPELSLVDQDLPQMSREKDIWETMRPAGKEGDTWDLSRLSDEEVMDLEQQYNNYVARPDEAPPQTVLQQDLSTPEQEKLQKEEEFGEEQFYLEPIE